jgi:uncharacterized membrane protein YjgN (DUF898 family)
MDFRTMAGPMLTVALLALALVAVLWLVQRSLIYLPDRSVPPARRRWSASR